jgi:hypothetical protein
VPGDSRLSPGCMIAVVKVGSQATFSALAYFP